MLNSIKNVGSDRVYHVQTDERNDARAHGQRREGEGLHKLETGRKVLGLVEAMRCGFHVFSTPTHFLPMFPKLCSALFFFISLSSQFIHSDFFTSPLPRAILMVSISMSFILKRLSLCIGFYHSKKVKIKKFWCIKHSSL